MCLKDVTHFLMVCLFFFFFIGFFYKLTFNFIIDLFDTIFINCFFFYKMSTFIFDLVKNIDFLENTNFSAFSTVTRGFDILNENGTSLIPKTVVSSFCTRTKSSTSNKIILVLIKITGGVGATLVFVNIFLCVHDHCKRKRSISTHQKSLKYNSIII